jgi:hypothetical protein
LRKNLYRPKKRKEMWRDPLRVDLIKSFQICLITNNRLQVTNSNQLSSISINLSLKTNNLTSTLTKNKLNKNSLLPNSISMILYLVPVVYKRKINKNRSSLSVTTYLVSSQLSLIKHNNLNSSNILIRFQRILVNSHLNSSSKSNNKFSQSK